MYLLENFVLHQESTVAEKVFVFIFSCTVVELNHQSFWEPSCSEMYRFVCVTDLDLCINVV